jgi:hypothetical protein
MIAGFSDQLRHVHPQYTPAHASGLNQVELFFPIVERRMLCRGEFDAVDHLAANIITSSRTTTGQR